MKKILSVAILLTAAIGSYSFATSTTGPTQKCYVYESAGGGLNNHEEHYVTVSGEATDLGLQLFSDHYSAEVIYGGSSLEKDQFGIILYAEDRKYRIDSFGIGSAEMRYYLGVGAQRGDKYIQIACYTK